MEIQAAKTAALRNEEHRTYHLAIMAIIKKALAIEYGLEAEYDLYSSLLDDEATVLQKMLASTHTKTIVELDFGRDESVRGITLVVDGYCHHPTLELKNAALHVKLIMGKFGDITEMPYDQETGTINDMLVVLNKDAKADMALIHVDAWGDILQVQNNDFDAEKKLRYEEGSDKTPLTAKPIRKKVDEVYRKIVKRINALIEVNGSAAYADVVNDINQLVEAYNHTVEIRQGRNAAAAEDDNPPDNPPTTPQA